MNKYTWKNAPIIFTETQGNPEAFGKPSIIKKHIELSDEQIAEAYEHLWNILIQKGNR